MGTITRTLANNLTTSLGTSAMTLISSVNSEVDVAEIDFALDNTTYDHYRIVFDQFLNATDDTHLRLYCSTNNGASYDTTSSNYSWVNMGVSGSGGPYSEHNDQATGYIAFTKGNPGNNLITRRPPKLYQLVGIWKVKAITVRVMNRHALEVPRSDDVHGCARKRSLTLLLHCSRNGYERLAFA